MYVHITIRAVRTFLDRVACAWRKKESTQAHVLLCCCCGNPSNNSTAAVNIGAIRLQGAFVTTDNPQHEPHFVGLRCNSASCALAPTPKEYERHTYCTSTILTGEKYCKISAAALNKSRRNETTSSAIFVINCCPYVTLPSSRLLVEIAWKGVLLLVEEIAREVAPQQSIRVTSIRHNIRRVLAHARSHLALAASRGCRCD